MAWIIKNTAEITPLSIRLLNNVNNNLQINSENKAIFINHNLEVPTYSVSLYLLLKRVTVAHFLKLIGI